MEDLEKINGNSIASAKAPTGVYVKTFGCQMNEYDSEKVIGFLSKDYQKVDSPLNAELVFVNTCSVREKGEHKLFSLLGRLRDLKKKNPDLIIGVGGCVAQQEGESIIKRNEAVDFVVGTHNLSLVPSLVKAVKEGRGRQVAVDYREDWENLNENFELEDISADIKNNLLQGARGLVSIQRGCNKKCAFCVVPTTRGPEVSRDPQEILREVKLKARIGAKEIVLLGQTVNSYGKDLEPRYPFEDLIKRIAEVDGIKRIRFTSPHPAEVKPSFIKLYAEVPQLCSHIHLPLQSGSDRILKLMNRNYKSRRYLDIVESLIAEVPNIAITSDIIVGFPTETEEDFQNTLDIMNKVKYHLSYSFKYSRRPNTRAIIDFKLEDEVPEEVASDRLTRLQELQSDLSLEKNQGYVGKVKDVLIENKYTKSDSWKGRIAENITVEVIGDNIKQGDMLNVIIKAGSPNGLFGEKISL